MLPKKLQEWESSSNVQFEIPITNKDDKGKISTTYLSASQAKVKKEIKLSIEQWILHTY